MHAIDWPSIRRKTLCRFGVHYDAAHFLVREGERCVCCYDCGLLQRIPVPPKSDYRQTVIRKNDGRFVALGKIAS